MTEAQQQQRDLRAAEQRLRDGDLTHRLLHPKYIVGKRIGAQPAPLRRPVALDPAPGEVAAG